MIFNIVFNPFSDQLGYIDGEIANCIPAMDGGCLGGNYCNKIFLLLNNAARCFTHNGWVYEKCWDWDSVQIPRDEVSQKPICFLIGRKPAFSTPLDVCSYFSL